MFLLSPDVMHLVGPQAAEPWRWQSASRALGIPFSDETTLLVAATHAGAMHGPSVAAGMIAAAAFEAFRSCP